MKSSIHNKITEYCKKQDFYFWACKSSYEKRAEKYFIFGNPESERFGVYEQHNVFIWLINKDGNDKYIGFATASLSENSDENEIKDKIDKARLAATLVKNPFFEIPKEKHTYPAFSNSDPLIKEDPVKALSKLSNIIKENSTKFTDVKLSTTELFVSYIEEEYTNANSNHYNSDKTKILIEGVFLAGKNLENESFFTKQSVFIDDLNLEDILVNQAKYAKDSIDAIQLKTGKYNVVFSLEALDSFFDFYKTHANARAVFNRFSLLKLDEPITDKSFQQALNIKVDPLLKGALFSATADIYGIPLKPYKLIENNVLKNYISELSYSQYLNIPYTGPATNFIIDGGNETLDQLTSKENTVLLLRFSAFSPKDITGDFSSEIRLGYITRNGKKIPIKGGSVSGNIRNLIGTLKLSKSITKTQNYIGPDGIYLEGVDIAGE